MFQNLIEVQARWLILIAGTALFCISMATLMSCSGGGGGSDGVDSTNTDPTGGWITITSHADQSSTYCDSPTFEGHAFISNWSQCCNESTLDPGVTVTWENLVTGERGNATQSVDVCTTSGFPRLCNHIWRASVPLALGDNIFRVTAIDPDGDGDVRTITVFKPEYSYSVSGRLVTEEGLRVGYLQSGVELELTGPVNLTTRPHPAGYELGDSAIGEYVFLCVPNGSFTLEATTSSFDHTFSPAFQEVTVADDDVTDINFVTEAWPISGKMSNMLFDSWDRMEISTVTAVGSAPVRVDGTYTYFVPAGSYRVTSDISCGCSFDPAYIDIDVTGSAVQNINFTAVW
jgi:hypothetical protein